jgi:hypothetical protein
MVVVVVVVVVAGIVVVAVVGAVLVVVGTVVVVVLLAARVTPAGAASAAAGHVRLNSMAATVQPMTRGAVNTDVPFPAEGCRQKWLGESSDTPRCRPRGRKSCATPLPGEAAGQPSKSPITLHKLQWRIEVRVNATPGPMNGQ